MPCSCSESRPKLFVGIHRTVDIGQLFVSVHGTLSVHRCPRETKFYCWGQVPFFAPILGRNEILASLCPQVFGLYLVKLAVAMVLAGGVQRTDATGTRVRG